MSIGTFSVKTAAVRFLAALCLVSAVSGCVSREIEPTVPVSSRLAVSTGDAPSFSNAPVLTKGQVYTEDGSFVFNDGEAISIWYDDNQYRSFSVMAGTVETGNQTAKRTNWSIYPLSAKPASSPYNGTSPYVVYAETYSVTGTETDSQMPMVAKNTDSSGNQVNKLVFYHVGGLLRLKLYGLPYNAVKKVEVSFSENDVTGIFPVNVSDATAPVTGASSDTNKGKTVSFNFSVIPDEVYAYVNVPLPAGEYPDQTLSVKLYDENNNIIKKNGATEDSFTTELRLGTVTRRDGRILGVSLFNLTGSVESVSIDDGGVQPPFLTNRTGGLYLNDTPFEAQLYATVSYTGKKPVQDNSLVDWVSADPTKVRVEQGKVMAVDVTSEPVKIWAFAKDDPTKKDSVFVTVSKESPAGNFVQKPVSRSATETVEVSPGNLVANTSGGEVTWRFATHQYDIVGAQNGNITDLKDIDIFYFSGLGNDYGVFRAADSQNLFYDWGLNQIGYRSDPAYAPAGTYRTLDLDELNYLLYTRTGDKAGYIGDQADCRFAGVNVEGVYGVIVFPDGFRWIRSTMGDFPKRINTYAAPDNSAYSGQQWAALEQAGVVFLPATGRRNGSLITSAGTYGSYLTGGADSDTTRTYYKHVIEYHISDESLYGTWSVHHDEIGTFGGDGTTDVYNQGYYSSYSYKEAYPTGYFSDRGYQSFGAYRQTGWSHTFPDTTRTALHFNTESFDGFNTSRSTTGSVRLVKQPPIPNTVFPILEPLPSRNLVSVSIKVKNGTVGENLELALQGSNRTAELTGVLHYSDGYTEERNIVKLVDPDLVPSRYFGDNDAVSIAGGKTVTAQKLGYALVYAEFDGLWSKPMMISVADPKDGGGYWIHTADGKRIEFAPGNLRAHMNTDGTSVEYWYFAPNQYEYLKPWMPVQFSRKGSSTTWVQNNSYADNFYTYPLSDSYSNNYQYRCYTTDSKTVQPDIEHFAWSTSLSYYGAINNANGPKSVSNQSFVDWGNLTIRKNKDVSNDNYPAGTWRTPTYEEWSDFLNCYKHLRGTSMEQARRGFECEVYTIDNKYTCTILVPDGLMVDLPLRVGGNIPMARWRELEALGCVALPHSGVSLFTPKPRFRPAWAYEEEGYYWQSTGVPDGRLYPYTSEDLSNYGGETTDYDNNAVYCAYLRAFNGSYAPGRLFDTDSGYEYYDENRHEWIWVPDSAYDRTENAIIFMAGAFWNPANMAINPISLAAVRLIRVVE